MKVTDLSDRRFGGPLIDLVVVRGLLRAKFPEPVSPEAINEDLANSWYDALGQYGGKADILRVASALHPGWRDPKVRPANRIEPAWRRLGDR